MQQPKIFNDPVHGFISVPRGIIFDVIEHPLFQRLRRIRQLGLTDFVYPGALHTRFHHALGAMHLMSQAVESLRVKGVEISPDEEESVMLAILLHDIGHGPFSHALEHKLINVGHEVLTKHFMNQINLEFKGRLDLAIQIFENNYPRIFLHQLISGQLDMDRLDYLSRDSFFTGIAEGVIGYDRIIKMLNVKNGRLVVEEKGLFSIEKFIVARRLMYWQAYLHKTAVCAEQMLCNTLMRARELLLANNKLPLSESLLFFLKNFPTQTDLEQNSKEILEKFAKLDDFDIFMALKEFIYVDDFLLSFLAKSLINRQLFKVDVQKTPFTSDEIKNKRLLIGKFFDIPDNEANYLLIQAIEANVAYSHEKEEIEILYKNNTLEPISKGSEHLLVAGKVMRYYLCYPKQITF